VEQNQTINKSIAFTSRRIPYLPELKAYCKTTNACILMTQLEYRFASMPEGFYKFLSPCEHTLYKEGDSWTEELAFSEAEMRNAFENIGEKYSSIKKILEISQKGGDPFVGKYYLSFRDVRNNLTYYKRNHQMVNKVAEMATQAFDPIAQQQMLEALEEISFLETNNDASQKLTLLSSGTQQSEFPYIRNHKKTSEEDNKKKLASSLNDFREAVIAEKLTPNQKQIVQEAVDALYQTKGAEQLSVSKELLFQAIVFDLLDKNSFRKCQQEFSRKLFSIKQEISRRNWEIPAGFSRELVSNASEQMESIEELIKQYRIEISHWKSIKAMADKTNKTEVITQCDIEIKKAQKWVDKYTQDLSAIN
tara:strand:+ start:439 stop:1527 length:1089 start_codon:yes stop_codon:yes gene_type:complete